MKRKSRGVQGINLNQGSDFDGDLTSYAAWSGRQLPWERRGRAADDSRGRHRDARTVCTTRPTSSTTRADALSRRPWRRAPESIASWLLIASDHLGDFPWWDNHDSPP